MIALYYYAETNGIIYESMNLKRVVYIQLIPLYGQALTLAFMEDAADTKDVRPTQVLVERGFCTDHPFFQTSSSCLKSLPK